MNSASVWRYKGDGHAIKFNCRDQFLVMSFTQFIDRSGLRDIETTLNLCSQDLYRTGMKVMPKSTLAEANEKRDWRIYQDFGYVLIKKAKALYYSGRLRIDLDEMVCAFDSSTIERCLYLCPWATLHHGKGGVNMRTFGAGKQLILWYQLVYHSQFLNQQCHILDANHIEKNLSYTSYVP